MKKILVVLLCITLILSCNSCAFLKMKAEPKVEAMLAALAEGDRETALEMLHPDVRAEGEGLEQLIDMIDGRKVEKLTCVGIWKNTSVGSNGTVKKEGGSFLAVFDDGAGGVLTMHRFNI